MEEQSRPASMRLRSHFSTCSTVGYDEGLPGAPTTRSHIGVAKAGRIRFQERGGRQPERAPSPVACPPNRKNNTSTGHTVDVGKPAELEPAERPAAGKPSGIKNSRAPPRKADDIEHGPSDTPSDHAGANNSAVCLPVDDETRLARALWAQDRQTARLARAVAQLQNGKLPKDIQVMGLALEQNRGTILAMGAKKELRKQARIEAETERRQLHIVREAEHRERGLARMRSMRVEEEMRREAAAAQQAYKEAAGRVREDARQDREKARRAAEKLALVDREQRAQEQRLAAARGREASRRTVADTRQEQDFAVEVEKDRVRRTHEGERLERERQLKEQRDPQVLRSKGHAALMKGVTTVAPYATQLRPRGFVLSRWAHGDG
jgi:hypothetical protein